MSCFSRLIGGEWSSCSRVKRCKLVVVATALIAVTAMVLVYADETAPIASGTSADFWNHACHVDITGAEVEPGGCRIYPSMQGWYVYYMQGFHGQFLYRVPVRLADADLPAVVGALKANRATIPEWANAGFAAWLRLPKSEQSGMSLQRSMRQAYLDDWSAEDPRIARSIREDEADFLRRWDEHQRYWLTCLFEIVWLSSVVVFAAYPWVRGGGLTRWAWQLSLLPLWIFTPHYLGYAPLTFTSAYPVGGIVYPAVLRLAATASEPVRVEWTEVEMAMVDSPWAAVLAPLSPSSGPMLCLSGGGGVSPLHALCFGLLLAGARTGAVLYCRLLVRRWRSQFAD
jgi:hypothetical protein